MYCPSGNMWIAPCVSGIAVGTENGVDFRQQMNFTHLHTVNNAKTPCGGIGMQERSNSNYFHLSMCPRCRPSLPVEAFRLA